MAAPATTITLPVEGMTCASCVARLEGALGRAPGVVRASVNLASESATLEVTTSAAAVPIDTAALIGAVDRAGFHVPTQTLALAISGMTCASCVSRVERALLAVPGVLRASVNLASERAQIEFPRGAIDARTLIDAVSRAGYGASELVAGLPPDAPTAALSREARHLLWAIALSLPLALPMLLMALGRDAML
ncbi:MAG TPA: copper ion binding protein, partial [Usitatibacteraceae bacterium]|nr:copper ion binding protein [Usitatibacteraceae bacterium]